jgi:PAS domain-containing protein
MENLTLQKIAAGTSDAIIIQTEGRFAWMNPAACRLFGTNCLKRLPAARLLIVSILTTTIWFLKGSVPAMTAACPEGTAGT